MNRKRIIHIMSFIIAGLIAGGGVAVAGVQHTFSAGTTARASEVNENFSALDSRITALEQEETGSTISDGSIDKSPATPDNSGCSTGSCAIGSTAYPNGNMMYIAKYTVPADGELVVSIDPAVVCGAKVTPGTVLQISMALAESSTFPPADPSVGVIGYTTVNIDTARSGFSLVPWDTGEQEFVARLITAGVLAPGATYKIFLVATTLSGNAQNDCYFVEAPVGVSFRPETTVDITPN